MLRAYIRLVSTLAAAFHTADSLSTVRHLTNLVDTTDWTEVASKRILAEALLQLAIVSQRQHSTIREAVAALGDLAVAALRAYGHARPR